MNGNGVHIHMFTASEKQFLPSASPRVVFALRRRWNVDPVYRQNISNYSCFSNSPISKVDPNGNSDYYTAEGTYLGSDGTNGTKIFIVVDRAIIRRLTAQVAAAGNNVNYVNVGVIEMRENQYFELPSGEDRTAIQGRINQVNYNDGKYYEVGGSRWEETDGEGNIHSQTGFQSEENNAKTVDQIGKEIETGGQGLSVGVSPQDEPNLSVLYTWHLHTQKIQIIKNAESGIWYTREEYSNKYGMAVNKGDIKFFGGIEPSTADGGLNGKINFIFAKDGINLSAFGSAQTGIPKTILATQFFFSVRAKQRPAENQQAQPEVH